MTRIQLVVHLLVVTALIQVASSSSAEVPGTTTPTATAYWNSSPGTADLSAGAGWWSDPQVAASSTHVVVTQRAQIGYFTRQGSPLAQISTDDFFSNQRVPGRDAYDLRCMWDEYRNRFWIVGISQDGNPTGDARIVVAVSKTQDPRAGWHKYWFGRPAGSGGGSDYPMIGLSADTLYVSVLFDRPALYLLSADQMANGSGTVNKWVWWDLRHPDGELMGQITPVVHHGVTPTTYNYAVIRQRDNKITVIRIALPMSSSRVAQTKSVIFSNAWNDPPDSPSAWNAKGIHFANVGTAPLNAVYRGGKIYLVTHDASTFGGSTTLAAIRLVQLGVANYNNTIYIEKNRLFGGANASDPAGSRFWYGWPAVEVNNAGDIVVVGTRAGDLPIPEMRYWVWGTNDADIRSSTFVASTNRGFGQPHCGSWCGVSAVAYDIGGISLDPDGTSVWMAEQLPTANKAEGMSIGIAKALGDNINVAKHMAYRSVVANKFVCAENEGLEPLIASRDAVGTWESFDELSNPDGSIALWSWVTKKYVSAEDGGNKPLVANRTSVGPWEKFTKINNSDGTVSFRSWANNKYVCADENGTKPLIANKTAIGTWEKFVPVLQQP